MDEIEYKLNTKNSVLVVNAIDKLISTIKSKYKPGERQKFVLENEELKFLRDKCSSKEPMVSLTACQGLLALVELGVLEIGHTMSTIVTLLPTAHNYSAIISTMAGLLILDLKSRLVPGQPYTCQFGLRSPQHPFITVLERNKDAEDDVVAQMHALCTHPDYIVSSNSLELLRPVFLWVCECGRSGGGAVAWRLLLTLPSAPARDHLLIAALAQQQMCNPQLVERTFTAYSTVTDAAIYQQNREYVMAFLPMLARISNELLKSGRDPRACYNLIERCFSIDAPELRSVAGLTVMLLAENLTNSSALYLHELFNLCLNIISKYEYSSISLNIFASLSLQWLHLPSYLTSSALKVASKILDIYQNNCTEDNRIHMANLKSNKTFDILLYTDSHLFNIFKLNQIWEALRDNSKKLHDWLDSIAIIDNNVKQEILPFLIGITMDKRKEKWYEGIAVKALRIIVDFVREVKELAVTLMPILLYKLAHDRSPAVKNECLRALPVMAKTKENVPTIVSVFTKIKSNKGAPTSFLIYLYCLLAENQVRCFPYLQEVLVDPGTGRADDLKWETDLARAMAVDRICEIRASTHGLELVSIISSILNKCTDKSGSVATCLCLRALSRLWLAALVAPPGTWRALQPKLARDNRPAVQISICKLLAEVPALRVSTPEYDKLITDAARRLWMYIAESNHPEVVEAACDALAGYKVEDYQLKDVPEIYRRTVKLPASYCKTPADAARRPEDVLDYVPCEVWPEVFKLTNQAALPGVQRLASRLVEREVKGYRSGVYQPEARTEPRTATYLPPSSVVRGLLECFRIQATSPSYDFPEAALVSIARALTSDNPKPLPPLDLCFIHDAFHRGECWRAPCVRLASRQAQTSGSARRFLDNFLLAVDTEKDVLLIFELLPMLCRGMPPNSLRPVIEKCLAESYAVIADMKTKDLKKYKTKKEKDGEQKEGEKEIDLREEFLFIKELDMIRECLENGKIHDANRTLLSQIVENYFSLIDDDNIAWRSYVRVCVTLSSTYLERMTSPSSWWESSAQLVRKTAAVRAAAATAPDCDKPLLWLNEAVDACAKEFAEQEFSLRCFLPALKAANPQEPHTREWFVQLMARTQVAFTETEDDSAKLYLCDVFMLSVIVFSGHWSFEPDEEKLISNRHVRQTLMPAATAALISREGWKEYALQMLEWLWHTGDSVRDSGTARWCDRALLAARHSHTFVALRMWKRLENRFGKTSVED